MPRRSRDDVLMATAYVWADRSTCSRNAVGAVISMNARIIATGYNGAPAGMPHCDHTCPCQTFRGETGNLIDVLSEHTAQCPLKPCKRAVHAEANAIAFSAKHGVATAGATLHTTMAPCYVCAQLIINAGITTVLFYKPYRDMSGAELLTQAGVRVGQLQ